MIINCTQKTIKCLNLTKRLITRDSLPFTACPDEHIWYCNILENYRDATDLLITHAQTRMSFIAVVLPEDDPQPVITIAFFKFLGFYELPDKQIDWFMKQAEKMQFVKGDNYRPLLGNMADMKRNIGWMVDDYHENKEQYSPFDLIEKINSTPYTSKDEAMKPYLNHGFFVPEDLFTKKFGGIIRRH